MDSFYRHPKMADGHLGKCKECAKRDVRSNRKSNISYYRSYDKARGSRASPESMRRYREANPEKIRAQAKVNNAIIGGRLAKHFECEVCQSGDNVVAHHHDYSKPLDVWWLCQPCHTHLHSVMARIT